jgi:general secretion pathway protein M
MKEELKLKITQYWNEYSAKAKEWWSHLSAQEKKAVSIGGSVLGVFLFYFLIWSPFLGHLDVMRKRMSGEEATLAWMQAADVKIKMIQAQENNNTKVSSPVALMSILQKQINQNALGQSLTQLKQAGNDTIEMAFKGVEFDRVISFLTGTIKQHQVSIDQLSATAGETPGVVDIQLVLKL